MGLEKFILKESRNGTIFHTPSFLEYHGQKYANMFFSEKDIFMPACAFGGYMFSHPGSSYGGPVLPLDCKYIDIYDFISFLKNECHEDNLNGIKMRLAPNIFHRHLSEDLDYALFSHGFTVQNELTSAIPLQTQRAADISSSTHRSYLKSVKHECHYEMISRTDQLVKFYDLLCINLHKHGTAPTHTLKELEILKQKIGKRLVFYGVYMKDELVAGSMVIICNDIAVHTFYLWMDYMYQEYRPMNYLVYSLIEIFKREGYQYLNLGISTELHGAILNKGLLRFKEGFGARGVLRKFYNWEANNGR